MIAWQKSLKVGNTDRYSIDLTSWLDGQSITGATLTPVGTLTTIGSTTIDVNVVSWLIAGVTVGVEVYDVEYTTTTRSDCVKVQLRIEDC